MTATGVGVSTPSLAYTPKLNQATNLSNLFGANLKRDRARVLRQTMDSRNHIPQLPMFFSSRTAATCGCYLKPVTLRPFPVRKQPCLHCEYF